MSDVSRLGRLTVCAGCGSSFRRRRASHRYCSRDCIWPSPEARFWAKVDRTGDCWVWTGASAKFGHGEFSIDGRLVAVHRFSWELHNGPIPEGLFVCHHCDNPPCVRPDHLFLGTASDNVQDAYSKGRMRYNGTFGTKHHAAKLDPAKVKAIRAAYPAVGVNELARRYGVTHAAIQSVVRRRTWIDVA